MRFVIFLAVGLASCVSINSKPALVGMTLSQYADTCPYGDPMIDRKAGFIGGECPTKPGEYTVIENERVAAVMGPTEMGRLLAANKCEPDDTVCIDGEVYNMRNYAAQQESRLSAAIAQDNRARGAALQQFGSAISASSSPVKAKPAGNGQVCTQSGEYTAGFNKVCQYECLGSPAAITVGAVELCPLTINSPN